MKRFSIYSLVGIVALSIAGCESTTTNKQNAEVKAAANAETPQAPAEWQGPESIGEVKIGWIASFNDPVLVKLVKEAQANNKDLQAAAANVERSRALAVQAGAALGPSVGLNAGGTRSGGPGDTRPTTSGYSASVQVQWELDIWGRVRSGARAASASAQAAEADYRYTQHSLAAGTARAYFTNIEANLQLKISQESLSILEETHRIVKLKEENGAASAQDLALARADLATARERIATLEGSQRDAARSLEVLLGRYPSAELGVSATLPAAPPPPPSGIPSEVLERRPDLIAAERRVASAFNAVSQAKAAKLPSVSLTGNIGGTSSSLSDLLNPENLAWQLGGNLLATLYDGGARQAQVGAATADQKAALAAYGQAALKVFQEVESSLDQGTVLATRISELTEVQKESMKVYEIAELRYKEGQSELLDLMTFQQRLISAQSNLASVRRLLLEQRVSLHLALGGDWK